MTHWTRAASRRFARLGRIGWIATAVFCGASALMTAWALLAWEDSYQTKPLDEIAYLVCLVFAVGLCRQGRPLGQGSPPLRLAGPHRRPLGVGRRRGGSRCSPKSTATATSWHPSLTQGVLMVFPVAAYACLLLLGDLEKASRKRMVLDGIIVAASLFVVSWVCVLRNLSGDGGASGATVLHITVDVVLMTTAILVWSRPLSRVSVTVLGGGDHHTRSRGHRQRLLAGVGGYHNGGVVDLVRVAGFGMLAFAALFSVDERPVRAIGDESAAPVFGCGCRTCHCCWPGSPRSLSNSATANIGVLLVAEGDPRRRGGLTAVARAAGEPAPAHRGRPRGVSRQPDRPGEPRELPRPAGPRDGSAPPQRRPGCGVVPRPRQLQGRQRCAWPSRRRRAVDPGRGTLDEHAR